MPKEKINTLHRPAPVSAEGEKRDTPPPAAPALETRTEVRRGSPKAIERRVPSAQKVYDGPVVVQVGWQKDVWVQLSIEADVSYFLFAADNPDGDGATSTSDKRSTVYTAPLDRDEINKLIRTLRRAREQVFGRDE